MPGGLRQLLCALHPPSCVLFGHAAITSLVARRSSLFVGGEAVGASTPARPACSSASSPMSWPTRRWAHPAHGADHRDGDRHRLPPVGRLGASLRTSATRRPGRRHRAVGDRGARLRILPPHGLAEERSSAWPWPATRLAALPGGSRLARPWPQSPRCGRIGACSGRHSRPAWPASPATWHEQ